MGKIHHGFVATRTRTHPTWPTVKIVPNGSLILTGPAPAPPLPNLTRPARGSLLDCSFRLPGCRTVPFSTLKNPTPVGPHAAGPALVSGGFLVGAEVLPGARPLCHCCGSAAHIIRSTFIGLQKCRVRHNHNGKQKNIFHDAMLQHNNCLTNRVRVFRGHLRLVDAS